MKTNFYEQTSNQTPTSDNLLSQIKDDSVIFSEGMEILVNNKKCAYYRYKVVKAEVSIHASEYEDRLLQDVFLVRI